MQTVKCESTFGNFKYVAEAEVSDEMAQVLASAGFLQIMQRSPASAAEKKLAGYEKRPEKFERKSISFSADNAKVLSDTLGEIEVEVGGKAVKVPVVVEITEHEIGASKEPVLATERAQYAGKKGDKDKLTTMAAMVKYTGEIGDGTSENAPVEFLRAMKKWKDESSL